MGDLRIDHAAAARVSHRLTTVTFMFCSTPGRYGPAVAKNRQLIPLVIIAGLVLIVIAIFYWVDSADALPAFFPGHEAGSSHHHVKHGLLAFVLGVGCFVFAWFQTGPSSKTV